MYRVNKPIEFSVSRRSFGIGAAALVASSAFTPAFASVGSFVDDTWRRAKARGVSKRVFDIAMGDFKPLGDVLELSKKQPEFVSTAADYVNKRVSDTRIGTGHEMRGEWAKMLAERLRPARSMTS